MKNNKLLSLVACLLVAGLVGCNGNPGNSSSAGSGDSSSESSSTNSENSSSEGTGTVTYETTPALTLDLSSQATGSIAAGIHTFGDFEMEATESGNEINTDNKTVLVEGQEKEYTHRINHKKKSTIYNFTAEKAGKLVVVGRSSSKDEGQDRMVSLYNYDSEDEVAVGTTTFLGGWVPKLDGDGNPKVDADGNPEKNNLPPEAHVIEFDAGGDYFFKVTGAEGVTSAGTHIYDLLVYYVA